MNNKLILLFLYLFSTSFLMAQNVAAKYWINFTDKENNPYSIHKPYEFLSPRAIVRRTRQHIAIEVNDLPVNPQYLKAIQAQGAIIHNTSKWLNATVVIADSLMIEKIKKLPFIKKTSFVGKHFKNKLRLRTTKKERDPWQHFEKLPNAYGKGAHQLKMINGHVLHRMGYTGKNILVAVLDGGFTNVDIMPFFDSLRVKNKLLSGWDFVDNDAYVYESSNHGSGVLSVMGSKIPGLFIGSAPDATYVCIKTEDSSSEYLVEECNWVAGAEFADSIGVDVLNSSLGYTAFNDKSMNHSHQDLDGKTTRASIAADIAFSKGMIIVNSAGNAGDGWWKYIGVPADGNDVLAIGATNAVGERASFSSRGVPADPRIKPNISAMGESIIIASIYGYDVYPSNGTSFAAPLVAGTIASLWQAFPEKTNRELYEAIEMGASQNKSPDKDLGYGIPDFYKTYQILKNGSIEKKTTLPQGIKLFSNPFQNNFEIVAETEKSEWTQVRIFNLLGQLVYFKSFQLHKTSFNKLNIQLDAEIPAGYFFLDISLANQHYKAKLIKKE